MRSGARSWATTERSHENQPVPCYSSPFLLPLSLQSCHFYRREAAFPLAFCPNTDLRPVCRLITGLERSMVQLQTEDSWGEVSTNTCWRVIDFWFHNRGLDNPHSCMKTVFHLWVCRLHLKNQEDRCKGMKATDSERWKTFEIKVTEIGWTM